MVDNYDVNVEEGVHTVEIVLQHGTRKATFLTQMGGNAKGSELISMSIESWVFDLELSEESDLLEIVFDAGLKTEATIGFTNVDEVLDHIVGVRIVDFTEGDY